ncbi:Bacteriophage CI repressor helix-turn-helix domain [Serratia marcescens]|uniref:phage repressor protein CI n=1 Tax=Serratia TaxID=613 RepID=UPI0018D9ADC5|nr:phage repressor protein CI [Serratia marcescens]MBH2619097.1 phage repressor protein CI [Serratia marcescens]CAI1619918.1 Bacteriophage CI repressor helix-turn-helix domain [Serratia marcescens]CAI1822722.1 Bacteriophage CI repressor helix-turn-helix domain [Serratia marcescens]CAI2041288.1 Bacteriophage CI repressor helix-turn-helix domain [Serratia marcescens]HEJ7153576.1 phage repressor protein CI [Serratia marcescens]
MNLDLDKGGRAAIERMIEAYGCGTKTALAELLGISKGTLSNRYLRDTFPADYVIQCALETGVSLEWLATGVGDRIDKAELQDEVTVNPNVMSDVIVIPRKKIIDGNLYDSNFVIMDKTIIPSHINNALVINDDEVLYLAEQEIDDITDGTWLIEVEGKISIKNLIRVPIGKIRVLYTNGKLAFEASLHEVRPIAKCYFKVMANV